MNDRNRRERAFSAGEKNRMNEASWTHASSCELEHTTPIADAAFVELLAPAEALQRSAQPGSWCGCHLLRAWQQL